MRVDNSSFLAVSGDYNVYNARRISIERPAVSHDLDELLRASSRDAAFDSLERSPPARCHPGTRETLLQEVHQWINTAAGEAAKICWLHGPAGAGKSAMAQTISDTCAGKGQLAASFFFSRSAPGRNDSRKFFTTLALQLTISIPGTRSNLSKVVDDDPLIVNRQHDAQIKQLIMDPFLSLLDSMDSCEARALPFLIVVDGLDECKDARDQVMLLSHLVTLTQSLPLRVLISSRPEPHIKHSLDKTSPTNISLYGDHTAHEDIYLLLRQSFDELRDSERHAAIMRFTPKPWPSDDVIRLLAERSDGYFIYASTVLKYVDEEYFSPVKRLQEILEISQSGSEVFGELDKLYRQILSNCPRTDLLLLILETLFFFSDPVWQDGVCAEIVEAVLNLSPGEVALTLRGLHPALMIKIEEISSETQIEPFHASFLEFLSDPSRAREYFIEPHSEERHVRFVRGAADWFRNRTRGDWAPLWEFGLIRLLVDHLGAAATSQRSLIEYLNECTEEWDISYALGSLPLESCLMSGYHLAGSLVALKELPHPPEKFVQQLTRELNKIVEVSPEVDCDDMKREFPTLTFNCQDGCQKRLLSVSRSMTY